MTKRVVFAGGVQVKALAKAYRLDVALDYDEDVYFIGAESITREAARKVVAAADILVTGVTSDGPTVPDEFVSVGTLRMAVPVVTADFIWPYASGAHPRNAYASGLPDGPYPAGFGDSYLDRLSNDGLSEDEAISRYLALDVAQDAGLDDKLSATLGALRTLDAQTGFDLADFIAGNFRSQWLFATRDRPNLPLFQHIAGRLFAQMGISAGRVARITETFLPAGAMPIHPGVLAHFGMQVPTPAYGYPMLDEGFFSFEAYCRRYWNYEFNRLLHAAIAKAESNPSEAIPELRLALERSPESRGGLRALREAERAVSDSFMLAPLVLAPPTPPTAPIVPAGPDAAPALPEQASVDAPARMPFAAVPPDAQAAWAEPEVGADLAAPAEIPAESLARLIRPAAETAPLPEEPKGTAIALVPRSAFGSSLVRVPPRPPSPTIDAEPDANEPALPALRFTGFPILDTPAVHIEDKPVPLTDFSDVGGAAMPLVQLPPDDVPEPEPQAYVELPLGEFGDPPALLPGKTVAKRGDAYTPLAPADHLIPMLPRMLPSTRGMASAVDIPFNAMPETMPPPPLRPVLPPELHPEPVKTSLMARLKDQLRK